MTLLSLKLFAQNPNCKVVLVKSENLLSKFILKTALDKEDSSHITVLQDDPNYVDLKGDVEFDNSAISKHNLIVQFYDNSNNLLTNQAVGINSITMTEVSTGESHSILSSTWELSKSYILIRLKGSLDNHPKNGEKIQLRIQTNSGKTYSFYFKYVNGFEPYNFANNNFGLWLPVNMYSTSFERSKNGVLFTAMPIGLAIGGKYNINQKFYLGLSATLNYTMANASDSTLKKSYFLQDFSVGPLFDIGGYAYFGYTYPINLTNEPSKLKPQYVLGFGVKFAQLLKGM